MEWWTGRLGDLGNLIDALDVAVAAVATAAAGATLAGLAVVVPLGDRNLPDPVASRCDAVVYEPYRVCRRVFYLSPASWTRFC